MALIGSGGYGSVYLWEHPVIKGTFYAVKKVPHVIKDMGDFRCFREAAIMNSFLCEYLNTSLQTIVNDTHVLIIQELANMDMKKWSLECTSKEQSPIGKWVIELLLAVDYLHTNGYIHGDIKPSNILLYSNNSIKLSDFSLTTYIGDNKAEGVCYSTNFAPPEVVQKNPFDKSADIWALGSSIYFILRGKCFQEDTMEEKLGIFTRFPYLTEMLNENPSERPTAKELLSRMSNYIINTSIPIFTRPSMNEISFIKPYIVTQFTNITADWNCIALASRYAKKYIQIEKGIDMIKQPFEFFLALLMLSIRCLRMHNIQTISPEELYVRMPNGRQYLIFKQEIRIANVLGFKLLTG